MKLLEAFSVLLIIGSAVVGPIENSWVEDSAAPYRVGIPRPDLGKNSHMGGHYRLESTAETCARAMKEIGAVYVPPYSGRTVEQKEGWFIGGKKVDGANAVLCIPAPSGLRK